MKILIVKTSSLGDIIHTLPVLNYLRKRFSNAVIDWVVEVQGAEILINQTEISNVITVDTKNISRKKFLSFRKRIQQKYYDIVFDLQGNIKSGLITFLSRGKDKVGFAWRSVSEWPNILFTNKRFNPQKKQNIRNDYLGVVQQYFLDEVSYCNKKVIKNKNSSFEKIMVCPGSVWKNKQVNSEILVEFLSMLRESYFFFVWGDENEKQICENLHLKFKSNSEVLNKMTLSLLQKKMEEMDYVIAMDSLPLHLAGMTDVKTFGIFGPSSKEKYLPFGAHGIQGKCPYGRNFEKRCPILRTCPTGSCIKDISAEEIYQSFIQSTF